MIVDTAPARAGAREWIGLAVLALPALLVSFDLFVLLLALPKLSVALDVSNTQQLWIVDIYGFMVGGFLITMGTVGDRIGRRRLLLIGAAAFGAASMLAAYSTSPEMLIATRALLGIAGASVTPSTLALISNMFRDPRQMSFAIGVWVGCFTLGAIIGPMVGGVLLAHFWWGSVFLLGVPVMVLLLALGPVLLPEYRAPSAGRPDLTSVILSLAAILPAVYGIKELARDGWQALPLVAIATGVGFGVLFVRRQGRLTDPLLDLRLFRDRAFRAVLVGLLCFSMIGGTTMVFMTQHFQSVEGLSPLGAALGLLPGMAAGMVGFVVAPVLGRRFRPAYLICAGLVGVLLGLLCLTLAGPNSGPAALVIGFAVVSFCGSPLVTLGTNLVVGSAPPEKAGSAAAMSQTANEFGVALGVATLGTLGTAVYRAQLADNMPAGVPSAVAKAAQESISGAVAASSGRFDAALLAVARASFTSGLHTVALVSAVLVAGVAVLIVTFTRHVRPTGR